MKTHTSQFKEDIKTVGKQLDSKITFKVDGVTQTLTSEDLNGVTPTFQGAILKSVMKELDIDSNVNIPIGTEVNYQFGVKLENDFEYLDYGNYIVYSSEKQEDTSSYKIICYDKMLYSMKQNEDLGITYPISIRDYINALCTKIGLEFKNKNDEFANFDRVLDKELYVGLDYTYRDILDELAQVTASTICLDNEDKVEIRYINDLTELNEVVGTNISINDSIDYKLNSLTLYGRSTQETSEQSANLFDENYYNNDSLYTDATYKYTKAKFKGKGRMYFKASLKEGKTTQSGAYIAISTSAGSPYVSGTPSVYAISNGQALTNNSITFDNNVDLYINIFPRTLECSTIFDNYNLWVSTDNINYVPFTPSMPSPDYPSPIESVGRKNIIKSLSSKWSAGINYNLDNSLIKKTMTFSCIIDTSITRANLYIIPATGVSAISLGTINFTANQKATKTFNLTDEQIQVIKSNQGGIFQIYKSSAFENANVTDAQLEKGSATDYVPYEHTEISVKVTGKNLFNKYGDFTYGSTNNRTSLQSDGTILSTSNFGGSRSSGLLIGNIKSNTDYTISGILVSADGTNIANNAVIQVLTTSNTPIKDFYIKTSATKPCNFSFTFNSGENTSFWISLNGWNSTKEGTTNTIFDNIQLEEETVVTEYEEYKSNSLTIDLQGNELCSLPNGTKDEVNITNGKSSIVKRTKEFILDENKTTVLDKVLTNTTRFLIYNVTSSMNDYPSAISTHFKYLVDYNSDTEHFYITRNGAMYLFVNKSIASTVDELKTWLSKNNVKFLHELAEPETINLGTVEMPHTYEGVSNITNSADTEMVVKYSKGWETINEEYLKDINVNFG